MNDVICDYCENKAQLVKGDKIYPHRPDLYYLNFYYCDNGHEPAYVGCHKKNPNHGHDGTTPLGRLADSILRSKKSSAHQTFDPIWKEGFMSRKEAYSWLAKELNISGKDCHIGLFNEEMCDKVVSICANYWSEDW